MIENGTVSTAGNRVLINGDVRLRDAKRILVAIQHLVNKLGYQDIILDFSNCQSAFGSGMLPVVGHAQRYRALSIDIDLVLPKDAKLRSLFSNCNWAHFIDPRHHSLSNYQRGNQKPATTFSDGREQHDAVNDALDKLLSSLSEFDRSHLKAIDWSMHEITDNVINHSQSPLGGLLQVTNYRAARRVEFVVCDVGIGIPETLREGNPEITSDSEALDRAIREGVTRDPAIGQGNGLYGSFRAAQLSGGSLDILSGRGVLAARSDALHVRTDGVPFQGTLVVASIGYDKPLLLEEALRFKGMPHEPLDLIDLKYEELKDGSISFNLEKEATGFGSRSAGLPVRQKLLNLARLFSDRKIVIDFAGVPLVSSSFADEAFGKLFLEVGPLSFMRSYEFRNVDMTLSGLINRAIAQRSAGR